MATGQKPKRKHCPTLHLQFLPQGLLVLLAQLQSYVNCLVYLLLSLTLACLLVPVVL